MSWPMVKLEQVATINPRLPKDTDHQQEVSFIGMASVSEEGILLNEEIRVLSDTKKGFTYFTEDDVLLAKITPCFENGKCLRAGQISRAIGFGSTEFHVIRADPKTLDSKYLFYMLWSNTFRFYGQKSMSGAAGQKRVSADFIKGYEIPHPPLSEQKRIAAILDKADAIRRKRQQAIELRDEFLQSVFLDMFGDPVVNPKGWEACPLKDQLTSTNNGLSRRRKEAANEGDLVLRLQDVHYDGIQFNKDLNRIKLDEKEKKRYKLDASDILFIRVNGNPEYVGRSAVFDGHSEAVYHNDHLIRIKIGDAYEPHFLSYCFNQKAGRTIISGQIKTSAGQHTVSKGGIEQLKFYRPPIELQHKFIRIKNRVQKLPYDLLEPELMFNSLSQKAFSGEL